VGLRADLDGCEKSRPHRDSIPGPSSPQRVCIPTELYFRFFLILRENVSVLDTAGTLHEDLRTFLIISRSVLPRMRNAADRIVQKIKTHFMFNIFFFENSAFFLSNVIKCGRAREATGDSVIRRMRFACWITKATDTHSEYAIGYLLLVHGNRGFGNAS